MPTLPKRSRIYQNHHFDSTRWDYFESRDDDIIVATSYKAGTTWTQAIVAHLLFPDGNFPAAPAEMSSWLDMRIMPLEVILNRLKTQTHRRFIKTHLPLDGMFYNEKIKYLYIARDARDVFMSLWNHYKGMKDEFFTLMNMLPGRVGDELPRPPDDIHTFWQNWITRGSFEWETDGWPYWSHLSNVQSWWNFRHLPNIQLFHYNDMLENTEREVRRMAAFLEIDVPENAWVDIIKAVSFAEMKRQGELYAPGGGHFWKGGAQTFLHKGTNGRWRDVLSDKEMSLYEAACDRALTPECREWLGNGGTI
ncbi:sulfotransferase domain-containing protein [Nitrosomonas sp. Is37]|uniref:sulfotransferase domain-containing protein n=1 Tax=Nitrosomonas sp. Is37 TaxID=3080535 RepID=UPI00294B153A|nr:sulfotransferase domain-containing protein [Nitrosomonas sp. Is37]MDV6343462.1 sulfotransferase domain-containing protein [Nitrosomonas sp. Is37]